MDDRPVLISTNTLPASLLQAAAQKGVLLKNLPFIETNPIEDIETISEIDAALRLVCTVIFTSQEAIHAVAAQMDDIIPDWRIYCTAPATAMLAAKQFGQERIVGTATDGASLAACIIEQEEPDEIFFFCGRKHRPELPALLTRAGFDLNLIKVYDTQPISPVVSGNYTGVLFFSPSAVNSFFASNQLAAHSIAFAIGDTTAMAIRKHSRSRVVLADLPDKELLLNQALEILTT